jgi:hypothetical protein
MGDRGPRLDALAEFQMQGGIESASQIPKFTVNTLD